MTTIKLNRYYPHLTECITLEVSDEIAVVLSTGGRQCDSYKCREREFTRSLIRRVVVYKLDRISRSILDFATMMELFQQYNVECVSSAEQFDTSTPMGRAMLNICIVFAQLGRETIQKRVTDAYYSRCQRGFHMSDAAPVWPFFRLTAVPGGFQPVNIPHIANNDGPGILRF